MEKPRLRGDQMLRYLRAHAQALKIEDSTPSGRYVVIGYSRANFLAWTRQYSVASSRMTFVNESSQIEGLRDYNLIVMPNARFLADDLDRLYKNSRRVYDTRYDYPVTEGGNIVRWERFKGRGNGGK